MAIKHDKLKLIATDVCPKCKGVDITCADSRNYSGLRRRARKCNTCKERWFTVEVAESDLDRIEEDVMLLERLRKSISNMNGFISG